MKKIFVLLFFIALAGQVFAQQGFYLKPILDWKWYRARLPISYSIQLAPTQQTPYSQCFQLTSQNNYRDRGFSLGLLIGYNFERFTIETGFGQDDTNSGIVLRYLEWSKKDSSLNTGMYSVNEGVALTKVPVRVYYTLFKKDSLKRDCRDFSLTISAFAGIDFLFKPIGDPSTPLIVSGIDIYAGNGRYVSITDKLYETNEHWSFAKALGFSIKWNKRNVNLLTATFYVNWAPFSLSRLELEIKNTDGTRYIHNEYADGSGFYINISKELNLRNFRKKHFSTPENPLKKQGYF